MGWTTTEIPRNEQAFVRDRYTWSGDGRTVRPIAMARRGRAWYMGYEFGYRTDDETVGPNDAQCPERILELLIPTERPFAKDWRERCRAWNARRRTTQHRTAEGTVA